MAVVQSLVVATIIFGAVWLVVWFAILFARTRRGLTVAWVLDDAARMAA